MGVDELKEDILLNLLVYNVENKNSWVRLDSLKIKFETEDKSIEDEIAILKENNFVEMRNDDCIRITKEGINYIIEKV